MKTGIGAWVLMGAALLAACADKTMEPVQKADAAPVTSMETAVHEADEADEAEGHEHLHTEVAPLVINADGVLELAWENLVPVGYEPAVIMDKYQDQIDQLEEGSPEEEALFEKIMIEFNQSPSNQELNGQRVRLPGFICILDEEQGKVRQFLLVPYADACIQSPPPPLNQKVLAKAPTGDGINIRLQDIYQPFWLAGHLKVEPAQFGETNAGYLLENASLEMYTDQDETAATQASQ